MVSIECIAPLTSFREALAAEKINERTHPNFPELSIFNYSSQTHFYRQWDAVTLASRGLVVNTVTEEIVARPFAKFFNYGDNDNIGDLDYNGRIEVMDKLDGALGILVPLPDGTYCIATRGSLDSIPARHATEVYNNRYAGTWNPNPAHTYLYEIIYPGWPIVLNYGDMDDIVLLGAIDIATGASVGWDEINKTGWTGPVVERFSYDSFDDVVADSKIDHENREGFVVHFLDEDKRIKLKFEDYLRLHKIIYGVTPLRIWEMLSNGDDIEHWVRNVPDEFAADVVKVATGYTEKHVAMVAEAEEAYEKLVASMPEGYSRKDLALAAQKFTSELWQKKGLFNALMALSNGMHDRVSMAAWNHIRPDGAERL